MKEFSVQTHKNNTALLTELWQGNFNFTYTTIWGNMLTSVVNKTELYSCKMVFLEFKIKSIDNNSVDNNTKIKTNILKAADNSDKNSLHTLILIGNYEMPPVYCKMLPVLCSKNNTFYWSGDAILSISQPHPEVSIKSNNKLKKAITAIYRQLGATIVWIC